MSSSRDFNQMRIVLAVVLVACGWRGTCGFPMQPAAAAFLPANAAVSPSQPGTPRQSAEEPAPPVGARPYPPHPAITAAAVSTRVASSQAAAVLAPPVGVQPYAQPAVGAAAFSTKVASSTSDIRSSYLPNAFFLGTAGLAAGVLAARALARRSGNVVMEAQTAPATPPMELVYSPKETYEAMVTKGTANAEMPFLNLMHSSIMGGAYVGMAGLLSLTVAGNMGPQVAVGAQKFIFAALFPVNLLLVLQSGAQLFTGNTATVSCAFLEGKVKTRAVMRSFFLSWVGNVIGCGGLAVAAWYTGLLTGGTGAMAVATVAKKVGATIGQTIVKAILCNWLVCMAVFLCTQARDLSGKMVGIWFPISMFVGIGFEHSVANMFLLPAGLLAGSKITLMQTFVKNLLPVTFGNLLAGVIIIAGGFYFQYGRKK